MWGLTSLLTSQHNTPLASLGLALPCPALPGDGQRLAGQADARREHAGRHHSSSSGGDEGSLVPFTQHVASLSPGAGQGAVCVAALADYGR